MLERFAHYKDGEMWIGRLSIIVSKGLRGKRLMGLRMISRISILSFRNVSRCWEYSFLSGTEFISGNKP
jgi:hypothetical protein